MTYELRTTISNGQNLLAIRVSVVERFHCIGLYIINNVYRYIRWNLRILDIYKTGTLSIPDDSSGPKYSVSLLETIEKTGRSGWSRDRPVFSGSTAQEFRLSADTVNIVHFPVDGPNKSLRALGGQVAANRRVRPTRMLIHWTEDRKSLELGSRWLE